MEFILCSSPREYTGLALGQHQFRVRATDAAGNTDPTPATQSWTIRAIAACGAPVTALATTDAWIEQNSPTNNKGTDAILKVKSQPGTDDFRALVRFALPIAVPAGCVVESATLRLYAASATTGRTLEARQITSGWSEDGVRWSSQPQTAGAPATTNSGTGYREWNVASQVKAIYETGSNHGFLIRDANEGGSGFEQQFHARDKGDSPPHLVIRFAPGP